MDSAEAATDRDRDSHGASRLEEGQNMANDATEVRVAGAGQVFAAPEGSTLPTDVATALDAAFVDMGYVTPDGVTFTHGRETEDLDAWQGSKVRVLTLSEPVSVAFALMQTSGDVLKLAFGGGTITDNTTYYNFTPPVGSNAVRALVIEFTDGALKYRYVIPRAQIEGEVSYTLTGQDALTYPLEFGVLDNTPKWELITDDDAVQTSTL